MALTIPPQAHLAPTCPQTHAVLRSKIHEPRPTLTTSKMQEQARILPPAHLPKDFSYPTIYRSHITTDTTTASLSEWRPKPKTLVGRAGAEMSRPHTRSEMPQIDVRSESERSKKILSSSSRSLSMQKGSNSRAQEGEETRGRRGNKRKAGQELKQKVRETCFRKQEPVSSLKITLSDINNLNTPLIPTSMPDSPVTPTYKPRAGQTRMLGLYRLPASGSDSEENGEGIEMSFPSPLSPPSSDEENEKRITMSFPTPFPTEANPILAGAASRSQPTPISSHPTTCISTETNPIACAGRSLIPTHFQPVPVSDATGPSTSTTNPSAPVSSMNLASFMLSGEEGWGSIVVERAEPKILDDPMVSIGRGGWYGY